MMNDKELKRNLVNVALNRARPVFFRVENEKKEVVIVGMPSNLYIATFCGFLIDPKNIQVDLTPVLEYRDKVGLVRVTTHPDLNKIQQWANDIINEDAVLSGHYLYKDKGIRIPFLTKKHPDEIQNENEALELFIPIFNEWSFEEECYANFSTFEISNARLKVDKITSQEDVERLLQQEKARYEEYKAKYPEDMALVEELYDKYKEKWIQEVESLK